MAKKCFCGHEMTRQDYRERWVCHRCGRTKPYEKPMTNFDRIKAMSVEEMVENCNEAICHMIPPSYCRMNTEEYDGCGNCVRRWLESEVNV